MWQGLLLCGALGAGGYLLAALPGMGAIGLGPLVWALLLGMLTGNLPGAGTRAARARPGLQFATRWLLRGGIVLFGLSLTLQQIAALGPRILLLDALVVGTVMLVGYRVGTRLLGLDRDTALLTCAGSAICGAAAVLATESTIRARPAATAMAVATVVLFGSLAMLGYPALYPLSGLDEGLFGIYIGATVHEVAQVVAAGDAVGPAALDNALIVKLVRVMLLVPFLLIVGRCWRARGEADSPAGRLTIPWFALGFLAMVALNSLAELPPALHRALIVAGQLGMTMAMAALGYETRLARLAELGLRPFLLALGLFGLLSGGGLLTVSALLGS
ncbi:YeiH family protein [Pseudomonas oligotrophica]|uniref:YeiH family protein n=1 Tax=Pseudomonas oligotrophica TaxID=2912055 RepID=UPI001EFFE6FF|nr:putative sulfate exporter family transporter [Pseudomonas oligotrophica]MCF7200843.1 putative sulfate exporter family transporter [Pseudomonas oligotrophica]